MEPYHMPSENDASDMSARTRRSQKERKNRQLRRRKRRRFRGLLFGCGFIAVGAVLLLFTQRQPAAAALPEEELAESPMAVAAEPRALPEAEPEPIYTFHQTEDTAWIGDEFPSEYAVILELESGEILAERNSEDQINPASMTKLLTLLVAAENISDLNGTFTMTFDITDYCYVNKCSVVGYEIGEVIPVEELFYGCILNSGADASLALAELAAGSHKAFVDLMNEKLEELGLSDTARFTNCVGLYDEEHYCSVQDVAWILKAALENEFCRQVMETAVYRTASTNEHPEGQDLINVFLSRITGEDTGAVEVRCAKTGYVEESGFCAASYGETKDGQGILCVTGKSTSTWQSIYDHAELYRTYGAVEVPSDPS